jgi:signal peptidase I
MRVATRVLIPVAFAGLLWFLLTDVLRFGTVVSDSMSPTLEIGDYYILRLDTYANGQEPRRGDVVVFYGPDSEAYVKRVIGVENDLIGIAGGRVWLNQKWLVEPYLKEQPVTEIPLAVRIPEDHLFVLGDNRNQSEDSRDYGPIPVEVVLGRVTDTVWPPSRISRFPRVLYEE